MTISFFLKKKMDFCHCFYVYIGTLETASWSFNAMPRRSKKEVASRRSRFSYEMRMKERFDTADFENSHNAEISQSLYASSDIFLDEYNRHSALANKASCEDERSYHQLRVELYLKQYNHDLMWANAHSRDDWRE